MAESQAPQQGSSGNLKYAVIGIVLLLAAIGVWCATRPKDEQSDQRAQGPQDAGVVDRPIQDTVLEMPEEEPDSGPPIDAGRRVRIVYRYVGGNWDCSGEIPRERAQTVIAGYRRQIRNCYERVLKVHNTLQGNMTLHVKVGQGGRVVATQVGGSLGDNNVFTCVRTVASTMQFPAPTGGNCAVVSAPFSFTPRAE